MSQADLQPRGWLQPGMGSLATIPPMHLRPRRTQPATRPPLLLILLALLVVTSIPLFVVLTSRLLRLVGAWSGGGLDPPGGHPGVTISPSVRISRNSWISLVLAQAASRRQQQVQEGPAGDSGPPVTGSDQAPPSEAPPVPPVDSFSVAEAAAIADLFLLHLIPTNEDGNSTSSGETPRPHVVPHELEQPEALALLHLLGKLWQAHRLEVIQPGIRPEAASLRRPPPPDGEAAASEVTEHPGSMHCSTAPGVLLLRQLAGAARLLQETSCATAVHDSVGHGGSSSHLHDMVPSPGLPYVLLRRLVVAVLHALASIGGDAEDGRSHEGRVHDGGGMQAGGVGGKTPSSREKPACRRAVAEVGAPHFRAYGGHLS